MVSFTKLGFQPGQFHRWYGITNMSLFFSVHWSMWCHVLSNAYSFITQLGICASMNQVIIGSNKSISPLRNQTIFEANSRLLLIGLLGTNFDDILMKIHFLYKMMNLKLFSAISQTAKAFGSTSIRHRSGTSVRCLTSICECLCYLEWWPFF